MLHQPAWGGSTKVDNNDVKGEPGKEARLTEKWLSVSLSLVRYACLARRRE